MKINKMFLLIFLINLNFYLYCIEPIGLQNLGNTCFLNATIQCLHSVEELTNFFLKNENKDLYKQGTVAQEYREFILQYQQEFTKQKNKLIQKKPAFFAPTKFVNKIWNLKDVAGEDKFPAGSTGDSQELLTIILDSFNSDIASNKIKEYYGFPYNNIPKTWIGQNLFNWFIKETLTYKSAEKEIKRPGKVSFMQSLLLPVRSEPLLVGDKISYQYYKNLNQCLKTYFAQEPIEYTIYEQEAPTKYDMIKTKKIATLPKILILSYKRYEFDILTGEKTKIKHGIPFPYKNLDLKEFVSLDAPAEIQTKYDLIAVSVHHGEGFHYTAFIKDNNKWFECNDSYVKEIQEHDIQELTEQTEEDLHETPYLLFYKQHPTAIDLTKIKTITLTKFSNKIKESNIHYKDLNAYLHDKKITISDILRGLREDLIDFDYIILDIKEHLEEKERKRKFFEKKQNLKDLELSLMNLKMSGKYK